MCEWYDELAAWFVMSSNVDTVNDILLLCRYHLHSLSAPIPNNVNELCVLFFFCKKWLLGRRVPFTLNENAQKLSSSSVKTGNMR